MSDFYSANEYNNASGLFAKFAGFTQECKNIYPRATQQNEILRLRNHTSAIIYLGKYKARLAVVLCLQLFNVTFQATVLEKLLKYEIANLKPII